MFKLNLDVSFNANIQWNCNHFLDANRFIFMFVSRMPNERWKVFIICSALGEDFQFTYVRIPHMQPLEPEITILLGFKTNIYSILFLSIHYIQLLNFNCYLESISSEFQTAKCKHWIQFMQIHLIISQILIIIIIIIIIEVMFELCSTWGYQIALVENYCCSNVYFRYFSTNNFTRINEYQQQMYVHYMKIWHLYFIEN